MDLEGLANRLLTDVPDLRPEAFWCDNVSLALVYKTVINHFQRTPDLLVLLDAPPLDLSVGRDPRVALALQSCFDDKMPKYNVACVCVIALHRENRGYDRLVEDTITVIEPWRFRDRNRLDSRVQAFEAVVRASTDLRQAYAFWERTKLALDKR
jgi:hypothetical protein